MVRAAVVEKLVHLGRRRGLSVGLDGMTLAAVIVAVVTLLPFAFILGVTAAAGWDAVSAMVFRPRVAELLANTAVLELLAIPVAAVLALALAWLTERTD